MAQEEERSSIDLRLRAAKTTANGQVYHYLVNNPCWSAKQGKAMIAQATQDYWLAYARQATDPELAKSTAMACYERLEGQVAKLRRDFDLGLSASVPVPEQALEQTRLMLQLIDGINRISGELAQTNTLLRQGSVVVPSPSSSTALKTPSAPSELQLTDEIFAEVYSMIGCDLAEDLSVDGQDDDEELEANKQPDREKETGH